MRSWQNNNREKVRAANQAYSKKNKTGNVERTKRYRDANPEKIKASVYAYRAKNPGYMNAVVAKRKAKKLRATPKWLTEDDFWLIKEIYATAAERAQCTGVSHDVDHIIPLQGEFVSGLHVPYNLRVIPASENRRKHNIFLTSI
jgi:molybdopterin/thiamine biosynthesis adenylyltransferase